MAEPMNERASGSISNERRTAFRNRVRHTGRSAWADLRLANLETRQRVSAIREFYGVGRLPEAIGFVILGEPVSKANSRQLVLIRGLPRIIKSAKAQRYVRDAQRQLFKLPTLLAGPLAVTIRMFYATERPDLDESLVLDVLQGKIYANDRQVREKHVFHAIDRANPRAEITVTPLTAQQPALL